MLNYFERKRKLQGELPEAVKFSPIIQEDQFTYNDVHELIVVPGSKTNIQEVVDAHKDKAGLKNMLALFAKTQDPVVFGFHDVSFGDTSGIDADEKDIVKVINGADMSTAKLAKYLGKTKEEVLKMTTDQIVAAVTEKAASLTKVEEKKEGE